MIKYISTTTSGLGFITHDDQKIYSEKTDSEKTDEEKAKFLALKFEVVATKDGINYVKVEGEEIQIDTWKTRIKGTVTTSISVNAVKATLPKLFEEQAIALLNEVKGYVKPIVEIKPLDVKG